VRHVKDNLDVVVLVLLIGLVLWLSSCVGMHQPSSTDRHSSIQQPSCALVERGGGIRNVCCYDNGRCFDTN
jgi:hypothetical protein